MSQHPLFAHTPEADALPKARNRCVICPGRADGPALDLLDVDPENWHEAGMAMRARHGLSVDLFEVSPEGAWTLRDRLPNPSKAERAVLARAWRWTWPNLPDTVRRIAGPLNSDPSKVGEALHSPCGRYRYALARTWDEAAAPLVVIGLNPSVADAEEPDPTVKRIEVRARSWGYGGLVVLNLFALISTDPAGLKGAAVPAGGAVGPRTDAVLEHFLRRGHRVLAGWGVHGDIDGRDAAVKSLLRGLGAEVYVLALTKAGHPGHPLYLPYRLPLVRWTP